LGEATGPLGLPCRLSSLALLLGLLGLGEAPGLSVPRHLSSPALLTFGRLARRLGAAHLFRRLGLGEAPGLSVSRRLSSLALLLSLLGFGRLARRLGAAHLFRRLGLSEAPGLSDHLVHDLLVHRRVGAPQRLSSLAFLLRLRLLACSYGCAPANRLED